MDLENLLPCWSWFVGGSLRIAIIWCNSWWVSSILIKFFHLFLDVIVHECLFMVFAFPLNNFDIPWIVRLKIVFVHQTIISHVWSDYLIQLRSLWAITYVISTLRWFLLNFLVLMFVIVGLLWQQFMGWKIFHYMACEFVYFLCLEHRWRLLCLRLTFVWLWDLRLV